MATCKNNVMRCMQDTHTHNQRQNRTRCLLQWELLSGERTVMSNRQVTKKTVISNGQIEKKRCTDYTVPVRSKYSQKANYIHEAGENRIK